MGGLEASGSGVDVEAAASGATRAARGASASSTGSGALLDVEAAGDDDAATEASMVGAGRTAATPRPSAAAMIPIRPDAFLKRRRPRRRAGATSRVLTVTSVPLSHDWPLNVRELEQRMKVAAVLADGDRLELNMARSVAAGAVPTRGPSLSPTNEALRAELIAKLVEHEGNVTHVSEAMGKPRPQVHRWLKRLGVAPGDFRR